ncbi:TNF receptor-associated factor 4-like isoform X1 [Mytilus californianus]|uniref:TNF receptor-associated factor 4-like isoform X1 n=2 Tax=Mytilus californianus TaxID=6549 RepID=UPI002248590D|nr:TNF receptor-associated factor 4-like isoform X1 [Mytilus californianus]
MPGYSEGFVDKLRKRCYCSICGLPMKNPVMITTCGHRFCESCLQEFLSTGVFRCPEDDKAIDYAQIYPDEELTSEVMNSLTRCRYVKEGCRWVDKLQNLQAHLDQCRFEAISCPNKCSAFLSRLDLDDHLDYTCPKRFVQCEHCNQQFPGELFEKQHSGNCPYEVTWCENKCGAKLERRFIVNHSKNECHKRTVPCKYCNRDFVAETLQTHQYQCPRFPVACPNRCDPTKIPREDLDVHVLAVCPSATISCTFKDAGCTHKCPRFSLDKHTEDSMKQHLQLMCGLVKNQQTEITQLCNALYTLTHITDGTFIWKITNYKQKFLESVYKSTEIVSEPFYTNRYGYKMAASVFLNGNGAGEGKYLSVYIKLLPGEFDNILDWPFSLPISFSVLDQNGNSEKRAHIKESFTPDPTWKHFQKPKTNADHKETLGFGYPKFISHEILKTRNYIRDDCIVVKVSVDNDKFLHP